MKKHGANSVVLDASALLAVLRNEPGKDVVAKRMEGAAVSSVNYSEVLKKSLERGGTLEETRALLYTLRLEIVPFDAALAESAAGLWPATRELGLSLADRCCLALGLYLNRPVLTADRGWKRLKCGIEVINIR